MGIARDAFGHPVDKGDGSEDVWLSLLTSYLPSRYQAAKAQVVDSSGDFSGQMDVVIFDRQYSPFLFSFEGKSVVPAESVYAVFEVKQSLNASRIKYAKEKVASVRKLHRTSLPIPHAGGVYPPKPLHHILGGILTLESDWTPPLGGALEKALKTDKNVEKLDFGCAAAHGCFFHDSGRNEYYFESGGKPATSFLFDLISKLQSCATVPMVDINAYRKWLAVE